MDSPCYSEAVWKYLPDPDKGVNKTQAFIKTWTTLETPSVEAAFRFLCNHGHSPLLLKRIPPDGLTVILEASHNPRIVFGRSAPTGDPDADIREIIAVLKANGVHANFND